MDTLWSIHSCAANTSAHACRVKLYPLPVSAVQDRCLAYSCKIGAWLVRSHPLDQPAPSQPSQPRLWSNASSAQACTLSMPAILGSHKPLPRPASLARLPTQAYLEESLKSICQETKGSTTLAAAICTICCHSGSCCSCLCHYIVNGNCVQLLSRMRQTTGQDGDSSVKAYVGVENSGIVDGETSTQTRLKPIYCLKYSCCKEAHA